MKNIELTVKEIIEQLQKFPMDAKAYFHDDGYMAAPIGRVVDIAGIESPFQGKGLTGVLLYWGYEE